MLRLEGVRRHRKISRVGGARYISIAGSVQRYCRDTICLFESGRMFGATEISRVNNLWINDQWPRSIISRNRETDAVLSLDLIASCNLILDSVLLLKDEWLSQAHLT